MQPRRVPWRVCSISLAVVALLLGGCADAADPEPEGERDESFMRAHDGKADSPYELEPGGPRAEALLEFVNTAKLETLTDEVGLSERVAENIVDERSEDDIDSLEELDDVPWLGLRAFQKLYDYAEKRGHFDDLDPVISNCEANSDCSSGQYCVVGSCADMQTYTKEFTADDPREISTATFIGDDEITVGLQRKLGYVPRHRDPPFEQEVGHRVHLFGAARGASALKKRGEQYYEARPQKGKRTADATFLGDGSSLAHYSPQGVRFEGEIAIDSTKLPGMHSMQSFDVTRTNRGLTIAMTGNLEESTDSYNGTYVWTEENGTLTRVLEDSADDVEIVAGEGGEPELLWRDWDALHRATREGDDWTSNKVATFPELEEDTGRDVDHYWTFEAASQEGDVHIAAYTRSDSHKFCCRNLEMQLEYIRLRGDSVEARRTIDDGYMKFDGDDYFDRAGGLKDFARDVAVDADGNVYLLGLHNIEETHRTTELFRIAPDGIVTRTEISNWISSPLYWDHAIFSNLNLAYDYSLDVSPAGDVAISGFEAKTSRLKVRTFRVVDE